MSNGKRVEASAPRVAESASKSSVATSAALEVLMMRWIASDPSTAAALRCRGIEPTAGSAEPVTDALGAGSAVLVLPVGRGHVRVARFRRAVQSQPETEPPFEVARWTDHDAVGYAAGGLLGLLDEPIYEEKEPAKKKWWQRILD